MNIPKCLLIYTLGNLQTGQTISNVFSPKLDRKDQAAVGRRCFCTNQQKHCIEPLNKTQAGINMYSTIQGLMLANCQKCDARKHTVKTCKLLCMQSGRGEL